MVLNTHLGKNIDGGWIIYRDSDNTFRLVLTHASDSSVLDTSNTVFSAEFYTPGGSTPKLTLTEAAADIVNNDAGVIDFTLTQEDIATIPRDMYLFVIKYSISGGDVKPLAQTYTNITRDLNPGTTTTSVNMNVNVDGVQINMAVTMAPGSVEIDDVWKTSGTSTITGDVIIEPDVTNTHTINLGLSKALLAFEWLCSDSYLFTVSDDVTPSDYYTQIGASTSEIILSVSDHDTDQIVSDIRADSTGVTLTSPSNVLTDAASIALTATKHTLTSSSATRTFTISYTGDDITIEVTLNATSATYTFPVTALCVSEGAASGNNTLALAGVSGDKYIIAIKKIGSAYYVASKNFGQ